MSLYIEFAAHSWYRGFAIQDYRREAIGIDGRWIGYTDDGNTYRVVQFEARTLKELKQLIKEYRSKKL